MKKGPNQADIRRVVRDTLNGSVKGSATGVELGEQVVVDIAREHPSDVLHEPARVHEH